MKETQRPVMFLHVPGEHEYADIERGRKVAVGLIRALVASWVKGEGEKDAGDEAAEEGGGK